MSKLSHQVNRKAIAKGSASLHDAAVTLGRAGGKVGGRARARKLTPARRSQIAAQGGRARHR